MLENCSVEAQRVVSVATMEARSLDHPRVGTEHLLLGLLSDEDGEPAVVLRAAGVHRSAVRHKVVEVVGADAASPNTEPLPFTARAQRALERAGRFSRKQQEAEVGAGHVLLGTLDVEGLACQVLRGLGVDIAQLRDAIVTPRADAPVAVVDDPPSVDVVQPRCPSCHALLADTLAERLMPARRVDESTTNVSVVYCSACGTTLGAMRPKS